MALLFAWSSLVLLGFALGWKVGVGCGVGQARCWDLRERALSRLLHIAVVSRWGACSPWGVVVRGSRWAGLPPGVGPPVA